EFQWSHPVLADLPPLLGDRTAGTAPSEKDKSRLKFLAVVSQAPRARHARQPVVDRKTAALRRRSLPPAAQPVPQSHPRRRGPRSSLLSSSTWFPDRPIAPQNCPRNDGFQKENR